MALVGFSVGRFHELIELATDIFLVLSRMLSKKRWIIPGDDELIERLFVFTHGSSVLSKGWSAERQPVQDGVQCGLPRLVA